MSFVNGILLSQMPFDFENIIFQICHLLQMSVMVVTNWLFEFSHNYTAKSLPQVGLEHQHLKIFITMPIYQC